MTTFAELQNQSDQRKLVRKIQKAVALIAPRDVELPETLFQGPGQLVDLKTAGWLPLGIVTPDGYEFEREVETEDIDGLGYASPVRTDITRVPRSITTTLIESGRKHVNELIYGTDLSTVTQDPQTGEVVFDEPDMPANREYRLLLLGQDGPADEEWVLGKGYGTVSLTAGGGATWGQEGAVGSEVTLKVYSDDEIGTPVRHYLGGTGALKYKDVLGYKLAA